jgi:hypothetical protein
VDGLIDVCIGLRDCGYDDPSVIEKVKAAALVVGDQNLIECIASVEDQDEMVDTILNGYDCGNAGMFVFQMDGSAFARLPLVKPAKASKAEAA